MGRAPCCDKANVKKGPWSPEEDAKLKAYIEEHGTGGNWIALPQKIGLKRCGKSCRLRWLNYLRPNIKHGGFSEEEDNIICSLYISIGSRWSIIAAQLPGRTDNDIKNYWNTRLKKKLLGKRKEGSTRRGLSSLIHEPKEAMDGMDMGCEGNTSARALSSSALERMQLHMQLQRMNNSPFSFYNNPLLWPKLHPLGERVLQTPETGSVPTTHMQQLATVTTTTALDASPEMSNPIAGSSNGFSSAASSSAGFDTEKPVTGLLPEELNELIYAKSGANIQQQHQPSGVDCYQGNVAEKYDTIWWDSNGFNEKSSSSSWDSATPALEQALVFQDYMMGYGL